MQNKVKQQLTCLHNKSDIIWAQNIPCYPLLLDYWALGEFFFKIELDKSKPNLFACSKVRHLGAARLDNVVFGICESPIG